MAAYIDLNPVRAGLVEDPKDYRFCGYAEAVAGNAMAREGLCSIWSGYSGAIKVSGCLQGAMRAHRCLIFGKGQSPGKGVTMDREAALKVLERSEGQLSRAEVLRCRVRYFTDGAILGSEEFVRGYCAAWQRAHERQSPVKVHPMRGCDWQGLAVIQGLRRQVFG